MWCKTTSTIPDWFWWFERAFKLSDESISDVFLKKSLELIAEATSPVLLQYVDYLSKLQPSHTGPGLECHDGNQEGKKPTSECSRDSKVTQDKESNKKTGLNRRSPYQEQVKRRRKIETFIRKRELICDYCYGEFFSRRHSWKNSYYQPPWRFCFIRMLKSK